MIVKKEEVCTCNSGMPQGAFRRVFCYLVSLRERGIPKGENKAELWGVMVPTGKNRKIVGGFARSGVMGEGWGGVTGGTGGGEKQGLPRMGIGVLTMGGVKRET